MNDQVLEVVGLGGAYSEALVRLYVSHGKYHLRLVLCVCVKECVHTHCV